MKGYFNEFWRGRGGIYKNPVKGAAVCSTTITEEKYDKKENKVQEIYQILQLHHGKQRKRDNT